MRAICPTCDTAYTIPDASIGAQGRKVRCAKCGEQWRIHLKAEADDADAPVARKPAPRAEAVEPPPAPAPAPITARADPDLDIFDDVGVAPVPAVEAPSPVPAAEPPMAASVAVDEIDETAEAATAVEPEAVAPPAGPRIAVAAKKKRPLFPQIRLPAFPRAVLRPIALPPLPAPLRRATPFFGPLVFATALVVMIGLFVFRTSIVAAAPGLAGFYAAVGLEVNLRGLTFGSIETLREIDNGQPVLVVEGVLSNPTKQPRDVPALRFALRDADLQELYAWSVDPKATSIAAGDMLRFRTRLVAPPDRATDLQIRFVERRNQQAGLK